MNCNMGRRSSGGRRGRRGLNMLVPVSEGARVWLDITMRLIEMLQ